MRRLHLLLFAALAAVPATPTLAGGSKVLNTNIYTTYNFSNGATSISWVTCGSTPQSEGCFQSGQIDGFGKVCAVLDTPPLVNGTTTKQKLYIFDSGASKAASLLLDVYEKVDVTTNDYDTTVFTLKTKLTLPIPAGSGAKCFAAANKGYIFAGTSKSTNAVEISKVDLSQTSIGGFSPPIPVTSIDPDPVGNVSINFGNGSETGFVLIGPSGSGLEDGGGNAIIFNGTTAYTP